MALAFTNGITHLKGKVDATLKQAVEQANLNFAVPFDYVRFVSDEINRQIGRLKASLPSIIITAGITERLNPNMGFKFNFDIKPGTSLGSDRERACYGFSAPDGKKYNIYYAFMLTDVKFKDYPTASFLGVNNQETQHPSPNVPPQQYLNPGRPYTPPAAKGKSTPDWKGYGIGTYGSGLGIYDEFFHNHTTYKTTKGIEKNIYLNNGQARSLRAMQFARYSKYVRGAGLVGSIVGTAYSGRKVSTQFKEGGIINIEGIDLLDTVVGVIGTSAAVIVLLGALFNPATVALCAAIGTGALIYGIARLAYDLSQDF